MVAILYFYFVIETVILCGEPTLMIASGQGNIVRVSNLIGKKEGNRLDAIMASVDVVS